MRLNWRQAIWKPVIWVCLTLAALAFSLAHAAPIQEAAIELGTFLPTSRLLELPEKPSNFLGLTMLIVPIAPLYWQNRVHALSVGQHVRWVGWHYELGARLGPVDLYFDHSSAHALDRTHPVFNPVTNAVAVRWRIL